MKDPGVRLRRKLESIPSVPLGVFPTPLQPMPRYGELLGHPGLYIKRDDMTGLGVGGNKTRSLQFLLGEALHEGATTVVAAGALQSNLCALTALAANTLGMDCVIVHNDDPPARLEGNMLVNAVAGATERFLGPVDEDERSDGMERVAEELRERGEKPYVITNSSATPTGSLGYVSAALELAGQCDVEDADIKHVAIPGAMAGTASGLVAGAALLGGPFHVHVINVEYPGDILPRLVDGYTAAIFEAVGMKPAAPVGEVMSIHHGSLGPGYGRPTAESMKAMTDLARTEGILLEVVYTSKTLAGLAKLVADGTVSSDEGACFVHTGGMGALFAQGETIREWL